MVIPAGARDLEGIRSQIGRKGSCIGQGNVLAEELWLSQGYRAPDIRRVYIPKPGKTEKRPLGVPTVADRALQRSTAEVLSAIYEQDFLPCSFGGRPGLGAHHALATLNEVIAGGKMGWVLEADLKNFFGKSQS